MHVRLAPFPQSAKASKTKNKQTNFNVCPTPILIHFAQVPYPPGVHAMGTDATILMFAVADMFSNIFYTLCGWHLRW